MTQVSSDICARVKRTPFTCLPGWLESVLDKLCVTYEHVESVRLHLYIWHLHICQMKLVSNEHRFSCLHCCLESVLDKLRVTYEHVKLVRLHLYIWHMHICQMKLVSNKHRLRGAYPATPHMTHIWHVLCVVCLWRLCQGQGLDMLCDTYEHVELVRLHLYI